MLSPLLSRLINGLRPCGRFVDVRFIELVVGKILKRRAERWLQTVQESFLLVVLCVSRYQTQG